MTIPTSAVFLDDFWMLTWRPTGEPYNASTTSWLFQWTPLTANYGSAHPGARAESTTFVNGSRLFLYGGFGTGSSATTSSTSSGFLNDVWSYDLTTSTWQLLSGSSSPIYSPTAWQRPKKTATVEALSSLPALAGAAAYVRNPSSTHIIVVFSGGYAFGNPYGYTTFYNLSSSTATFISPRNPPPGRAGAILYPSIYSGYALQYGGYSASGSPLTDLTWLETTTGVWTYVCDTSFCSKYPGVSWCSMCLSIVPTDNYSGLRFASYSHTNSSLGLSVVALGGQTRTVIGTPSWVTANWTTVRAPDLPRVALPINYCTQPNPAPSSPYVFQCVGNSWVSSDICRNCSLSLNITSGVPVQIAGDFAPGELSMVIQDCTFLNVSGTMSVANVTGSVFLTDLRYQELARDAATSIPFVQSASIRETTLNSTPVVYTVAQNRTVIVDSCQARTLSSTAWILNRTASGRATLDVSLTWNSVRISDSADCDSKFDNKSKDRTKLVLLILLLVAAALLLLIAAGVIVWKHERIKKFVKSRMHHVDAEEASEAASKVDAPNPSPAVSYELDSLNPPPLTEAPPRSTTKLVIPPAYAPRVAIAPLPVAAIYSAASNTSPRELSDAPKTPTNGDETVVLDVTPAKGATSKAPIFSSPPTQLAPDSTDAEASIPRGDSFRPPQRPFTKAGGARAGSTPRRAPPPMPLRNAKSMTPRAQPTSSPIISRNGLARDAFAEPQAPVPSFQPGINPLPPKKTTVDTGPIIKPPNASPPRGRSSASSANTPKSFPPGAKMDIDYESGLGSLESSMQNDENDDNPYIPDFSHV